MLIGAKQSVWLRNVQLALVGIWIGLPAVLVQHSVEIFGAGVAGISEHGSRRSPDSLPPLPQQQLGEESVAAAAAAASAMAHTGFFQGYNAHVWAAVVLHATSGIVVALVIKYVNHVHRL